MSHFDNVNQFEPPNSGALGGIIPRISSDTDGGERIAFNTHYDSNGAEYSQNTTSSLDNSWPSEFVANHEAPSGNTFPSGTSQDSRESVYTLYNDFMKSQPAVETSPDEFVSILHAILTNPHHLSVLMQKTCQAIFNLGLAGNLYKPGSEKAKNFGELLYRTLRIRLSTCAGKDFNADWPPVAGHSNSINENMRKRGAAQELLDQRPGPSKMVKQSVEHEGADSPPSVPVFRPVLRPCYKVKDVVWQKAKNALWTKEKIYDVGKIFFKAVMRAKEIRTQTMSGRNSLKGQFNGNKLRWIRAATLFIRSNPPPKALNTAGFQLALSKGFKDFTEAEWKVFRTTVFNEYAYHLREYYK